MESLFLYLVKSSGLIAVFYLSYYFMVRKETFFNSNRWFLLGGLFTAVLLPFFFIKKVILVERPKVNLEHVVSFDQPSSIPSQEIPLIEMIDWTQLLWVFYTVICCVFVVKIIVNLLSLYQLIHKKQITKIQGFKLVDINENIAPFSFFNYIVFNSNLYTKNELQSILMHEKIHSKEKHSIDVLIAKIFCIVFWFHPFMWLYKKAIIQNLEYIADQKAIQQLEDRKTYQHALLKVISHQNALSITNNFYQSLIKKRIVMLNKNQSNKSKSWKYLIILPLLVAFIFLFQIKTIAQERYNSSNTIIESHDGADLTFDATETDKNLKSIKNVFKEEKITTTISKVKRNSNGEITGLHIKMKSEDGRKKELKINQNEPIDEIFIYTNKLKNGLYDFGVKHLTKEEVAQVAKKMHIERAYVPMDLNNEEENNYSYNFNFEIPEFEEVPEYPETDALEFPEFPESAFDNIEKSVVIKKDNEKPIVIINGKIVDGNENLLDKKQLDELINSTVIKRNGNNQKIIINGKDINKIRSEAFTNARREIKKISPQIRARVNDELEKVKKELERTSEELNGNLEKAAEEKARVKSEHAEMEEARQEMLQAKKEMLQAKAEMEAARAELEKAKANLKSKK